MAAAIHMHRPFHRTLHEKAVRLKQMGLAILADCGRLGGGVWTFAQSRRRELIGAGHGKGLDREQPLLTAGNLSARLGGEKDFLISLVHGMEKEFLATGEGLSQLAQQLNGIQKKCKSLTELTLGQGEDAAVQFAFQLLKKAEDLVLASYEQYDHVFATFNELRQRLAQLSSQYHQLMRVLSPLNFITMSFRIEASRHPVEVQESFTTLAANVTGTVNEVRNTLQRQFEDLAASERIAGGLMEQVSASIQKHRAQVTATLEKSRRNLRALSEALTSSGAGAANLSHLNQAVHRHIGGIVMAQQCQDITRQRVEHVGEAMDEIRAHLVDDRPARSGTDSENQRFVFRAGEIQLHQVQDVFGQLNGAADSLKSGIRSLRTEAGAAAEVAVKVGASTLDANVAGQCQAGIGEILGIVRQAVQRIADITAAFAPLQASFVDCTSQAGTLANDVRLAGLNAQVFAIHAPNGATLEVLAGRVRAISEDVIHLVGVMGSSLNHTTEMVHNLRQRLEDFEVLSLAEQEVLADESALSRKKLSELEGAIPILIRSVNQQQMTFAQSVEKVLANVQFPVTVAAASARSIGFFRDLVAWGSDGGSELVTETPVSRKIELLKSKYTMASEHDAHAAALQPVAATAGATAGQPAIEMFDDFMLPLSTVAGSAGEIVPQSESSENQPGPATLAAGEATLLAPAPPLAEKNPIASAALGDNVELF
jgi:hypothetical protein